MADVTVYGKQDCTNTLRLRALLDAEGVAYRFIDILADDDARERARELSGVSSVPVVVVVPSGRVLVEPSDEELLAALGERAPLAG